MAIHLQKPKHTVLKLPPHCSYGPKKHIIPCMVQLMRPSVALKHKGEGTVFRIQKAYQVFVDIKHVVISFQQLICQQLKSILNLINQPYKSL